MLKLLQKSLVLLPAVVAIGLFILTSSMAAGASEPARLQLTPEEYRWLAAHPVICISNETDYPPFDFAVGGQPQGFSIDLLNLLAKRAGFKVQYVTGPTWGEFVEMFGQNKVDLLHSLNTSLDRDEQGLFSAPYARVRSVFVVRRGEADITGFDQLSGKTVAVGKGWKEEEFIAKRYPGIRMLLVDSTEQMLNAVSQGRADATVEGESTTKYWMRREGLTDLKIAGWAKEIDENKSGSFHFYAHKDAPELISVLDKALASLPANELQALQDKWLDNPEASGDDRAIVTLRARLTSEERAYLSGKGAIKMCVLSDWLPYERINKNGELKGIAADIVALMEERLGTHLVLHATKTWDESLAAVRARGCDLLPLAMDLPSRHEAMAFSAPYLSWPLVVATRSDELFIRDGSDIGNRPVGVSQALGFVDVIRQRYPDMRIVEVKSAGEGLEKVRSGELWGYIDTIPSIAYGLQQHQMFDLKIAGKLEFNIEFAVATRKDEPLLGNVMRKVTDSITEDERRSVVNKWVSIRYERDTDFRLVSRVILIAAAGFGLGSVFFLVVIKKNRKLARLNKEVREHQKRLEHVAHHDILTNLPNRVLLADRLGQGIAQSLRRAEILAVAYLDLDGFKEINDRHGHNIGDELLVVVANRMKSILRAGDTLARIGGDEFVAILTNLTRPDDCEPLLACLLKAAHNPVTIGGMALQVSASIGATLCPQDGTDADLLIRQADQAMYLAKQAGRNCYQMFDRDGEGAAKEQSEVAKQLRRALERREFVLYYQPKVNMRTDAVTGVEALIRWQHPERGLLSPAAFLPAVEDHPIGIEIGDWVIDTALAQVADWRRTGLELSVSVNVSALQLQQADFAERLAERLRAHPSVHPSWLELEILETSAFDDIGPVTGLMKACQEMGVRFALDDFGTGYGSLTYLRRLPAGVLKIDQTFVRDMLTDKSDRAIVNGVVGLAKAFEREVIAEGVETTRHGAALLALGCELAQGYGIARPMPGGEVPGWIAQWEMKEEKWIAAATAD